ncbi:MAG: EF-hand domain-containing protein [Alphaproteobacteria bacterium]|nr:EF-hand domain-containing protein [Alphaproteobacteria bacterium]
MGHTRKLFCAAAMTLAIVHGGAALAADKPTEAELRAAFDQADVNSDGHVDVDEFVGYFVSLFGNFDANGDGFLTPDELEDVTPEEFNEVDRNGDGKISLGEGIGARIVIFFDSDTDRNGVMTFEELLAYENSQ